MGQALISCLCPTYGRATALGESLECFLAQDYEPRELIIMNDAPVPITDVADNRLESYAPGVYRHKAASASVRVYNKPLFSSLGEKYQAMLSLAAGDYVAHWEDDDLYLPGHLSRCVHELHAHRAIKSSLAYVLSWAAGKWAPGGIQGNVFEAQTAYRTGVGLDVGYLPGNNPAFAFITKLSKNGALFMGAPEIPTYAFRWDTRMPHGQCVSGTAWRAGNRDFSEVLRACSVDHYWHLIHEEVLA